MQHQISMGPQIKVIYQIQHATVIAVNANALRARDNVKQSLVCARACVCAWTMM